MATSTVLKGPSSRFVCDLVSHLRVCIYNMSADTLVASAEALYVGSGSVRDEFIELLPHVKELLCNCRLVATEKFEIFQGYLNLKTSHCTVDSGKTACSTFS